MSKQLCCLCGKIAVWTYMPSNGGYYCNDCISSKDDMGCSCNFNNSKTDSHWREDPEGVEGVDWRWVETEETDSMGKITKEDGLWINLDELGRPYPCAEYEYDENGFDKPTIIDKIDYWFWSIKNKLKYKLKKRVRNLFK